MIGPVMLFVIQLGICLVLWQPEIHHLVRFWFLAPAYAAVASVHQLGLPTLEKPARYLFAALLGWLLIMAVVTPADWRAWYWTVYAISWPALWLRMRPSSPIFGRSWVAVLTTVCMIVIVYPFLQNAAPWRWLFALSIASALCSNSGPAAWPPFSWQPPGPPL